MISPWRAWHGRRFRSVLPGLLVLAAAAAGARPARAAGLAAVMSQDLAPYREALDALVERTGVPISVHDLKADPGGEDGVLRKLREEKPEVVVALGARAAQTLNRRLQGVPIVFCMVLGLDVRQLAGPWTTGVTLEASADEQIAAFHWVVPSLTRLAILYDPAKSQSAVEGARSAAASRELSIVAWPVNAHDEVPAAFRSATREADGIWLVPDSTVVSRESFDFIMRQSVEKRIPVMVFSEPLVRAGGLLCVAAENHDVGRQVGEMVLRILERGGRPLPPVERPRSPRVILNLRAAEALGLKVPESAISRAHQVIR